jgi:hypothetical protein
MSTPRTRVVATQSTPLMVHPLSLEPLLVYIIVEEEDEYNSAPLASLKSLE